MNQNQLRWRYIEALVKFKMTNVESGEIARIMYVRGHGGNVYS